MHAGTEIAWIGLDEPPDQSEATIGAALNPFREGVVVATKGGYQAGHGRPDVLRREIEQSLERLQTDVIPLYYLHRVHPDMPPTQR